MDIKLENNKAIFSQQDLETFPEASFRDMVIIKTFTHNNLPRNIAWFLIKPGLYGSVVGFADSGTDVDYEIVKDLLAWNKNLTGDSAILLNDDGGIVYSPGYHRCKHDDVEYETFKLDIIE